MKTAQAAFAAGWGTSSSPCCTAHFKSNCDVKISRKEWEALIYEKEKGESEENPWRCSEDKRHSVERKEIKYISVGARVQAPAWN